MAKRFKRQSDGKLFTSTDLLHWVPIVADGDDEKDSIKCYGPGLYVSDTKGFTYEEVNQTIKMGAEDK